MAAAVLIQLRFNSAERGDRSPRSVFVPRPTVGARTVVRCVAAARIARDAGVGYCRCLAVLYRACERYRRVAIKEDVRSLAGPKLVHAVCFVDDRAVVSPLVHGAVRIAYVSAPPTMPASSSWFKSSITQYIKTVYVRWGIQLTWGVPPGPIRTKPRPGGAVYRERMASVVS